MASSSKGQRLGSWRASGPYPQLMRPRFLDPLSPFGEISSIALMTNWRVGRSSKCVSLEHDDRQVNDLPTVREVSAARTICHRVSSTRLKQLPFWVCNHVRATCRCRRIDAG